MGILSKATRGLVAGAVGAVATTALHEYTKRRYADAPRLDLLGDRMVKKGAQRAGFAPPRGRQLRRSSLLLDLVANTAYFGLAAGGRRPLVRGALAGLAQGLGAAAFAPKARLGRWPVRKSRRTPKMAAGMYIAGGIASALTRKAMRSTRSRRASRLISEATP